MKIKRKAKDSSKRLKAELEDFKNQLARALADYDNLKRRVEKEKDEFRRFAGLALIARMLPIFDMLEDAQSHLGDPGIAITIKEFEDVLAEEGVKRIETKKGDKFDENLHEAVEVVKDAKVKDGEITEELMSGWKFEDGPTIRHAKVKVAGERKEKMSKTVGKP
jgi:molecular chaperone GrpE